MNTPVKQLQIDIVSDVSCPWCIIGYKALDAALDEVTTSINADITWHPFELNPQMPKEGQEINEHLGQKYGINQAQINQNREAIAQRGLSVGYEFGNRGGGRIYNTFDAHRLLHWAKLESKQTELKLALFDLYFKESGDPSNHEQLLNSVNKVGLDTLKAKDILTTNKYAEDVRKEQQYYHSMGISSVPAVIVNNKHLISGGQPVDVFVSALKQIANEANTED
jgi:predicted DsbA family dithiol-disulfide isomerase